MSDAKGIATNANKATFGVNAVWGTAKMTINYDLGITAIQAGNTLTEEHVKVALLDGEGAVLVGTQENGQLTGGVTIASLADKDGAHGLIKNYALTHEKYINASAEFDVENLNKILEDYDTEIFMDVNLKHYPLRDYKSVWSEMQSIVKAYSKIGIRNSKAIEHGKLGKHMMHLIRLYMMCIDILEKEQIVTYREAEHDLLMDIRNGYYQNPDGTYCEEFFEMVEDMKNRLEYAKKNTSLPDHPNMKQVEEFVMSVNRRALNV